jgi:hypothetical protein
MLFRIFSKWNEADELTESYISRLMVEIVGGLPKQSKIAQILQNYQADMGKFEEYEDFSVYYVYVGF